MRRLPLAYSCDRQWSQLKGDSTVRGCEDCGCSVLNLSSLDEASARKLLAQPRGRLCVRYRSRRGNILFAKMRNALAVAAAAILISSSAAADTATPPPAPAKRVKVKPQDAKPQEKHAKKQKKRLKEDAETVADCVGLVPRF